MISPTDTPTQSKAARKTTAKKSVSKKSPRKRAKTSSAMEKAYPMVSLINEVVEKQIPAELVARVKGTKDKKQIISSVYPYDRVMKKAEYERQIALLQIELVKMQAWAIQTGEKVVMIFEGRDAAGKGGTITRFTENLNPRGAHIVALPKPTDRERGQWYFQRYVANLPTSGELVFLDRSWYNRAGVEKVMGFCPPRDYLEFMRQAPEFERMITRSGVKLFKFWFSVSREEQLRRFLSRAQDPLKQWKLSPMDLESLGRWDEYTEAKESMLFYTDTADAPWTIVRSDDKKRARLNAIKYLLNSLPYSGKDEALLSDMDPLVVGSAKTIYEQGERVRTPVED
ncbi:MAG: polyphosphate kinase 2 [Verrucomicrobiales bacterium]|nr:polyphosphate kinase 2 [Verrucomicrobiales bacterium]